MGSAQGRSRSSRYEKLWEHANAGYFLAIVQCDDPGDQMKVGFRMIGASLGGWFGKGSSNGDFEEFAVVLCNDGPRLHSFIRRVQSDVGLSAIVAEGFEITLFWPISRDGKPKAVFQQPFGLSSRVEHLYTGGMILSYDFAEQQRPDLSEWIARLEAAYSEVRGYTSFTFDKNQP